MKKQRDKVRQLAELYEDYEQKVYVVAYSILRSKEQAEDVTQATFIQLYQQLDHLLTLDDRESKRFVLRVAKK